MQAKEVNPHRDHRQRMREKVAEFPGMLRDHELLEAYLYGTIPYKDTNPVAHELLDTFGGLAGVVAAPVEALCEVRHMTYNAAVSLKMLGELHARLGRPRLAIEKGSDAVRALQARFAGAETERLVVLGLDAALHVVLCREFAGQDGTFISIAPAAILRAVLVSNATGVILAHNHPGGRAYPSPQDRDATERMRRSLADSGVRLIDHYIFAGGSVFSMLNDRMLSAEEPARPVANGDHLWK